MANLFCALKCTFFYVFFLIFTCPLRFNRKVSSVTTFRVLVGLCKEPQHLLLLTHASLMNLTYSTST